MGTVMVECCLRCGALWAKKNFLTTVSGRKLHRCKDGVLGDVDFLGAAERERLAKGPLIALTEAVKEEPGGGQEPQTTTRTTSDPSVGAFVDPGAFKALVDRIAALAGGR